MTTIRTHAWQEAAAFAARHHLGHFRKDNATPYISHPFRVTLTVATVFGVTDETVMTASLLHDTIEDCRADFDEIADQFGARVAEIVALLSKDMRAPEDRREAEYDAGLAAGPWEARLIKLGDVYDNYCDARSDAMREKAKDKVLRALKLAAADPECATAVKAVEALIHSGKA